MLSSKAESMFKQAIREAEKSQCNYRLGSVVVKKRILGRACNIYKTHPLTNERPHARVKGVHAEIAACLNAPRSQVEGSDIYVVRILKDNSLALARPCDICYDVLSRFGINRVFYTIA